MNALQISQVAIASCMHACMYSEIIMIIKAPITQAPTKGLILITNLGYLSITARPYLNAHAHAITIVCEKPTECREFV